MTQLALVIIGDVLFGVELWTDAGGHGRRAQIALRVLKTRVAALAPLPLWVPTPDNRRFNAPCARCNDGVVDASSSRTRNAERRRAPAS